MDKSGQQNCNFSHFNSIGDKNPGIISSEDFITAVKTGIVKGKSIIELIENIRNAEITSQRSLLKKKLPAITVSSICKGGHRKDNIVSLTGFLQIDIDKLTDVAAIKELVKNDPHIFILFVSPGGNGLKCVFNIGDLQPANVFEYVKQYFKDKYDIEIDPQVKDESRLCFYSYDPDIVVNNYAKAFVPEINPKKSIGVNIVTQIENFLHTLESAKLDITSDYKDWIMLAFALTDAFGKDGEQYFHRLSRFYPHYDYNECSRQYNNCLKSGSRSISIDRLIDFISEKLKSSEFPVNKSDEEEKINDIVFFTPSYDRDGNLKDLKIDYTKWIEVLYKMGFRRFDVEKNYVFVRVERQIIEEVTVTHIQDEFIRYLENLPDKLSGGVSREILIGKFYRNPSHYFCENRLNLLRPKEPFVFTSDTKSDCMIYFENGFVHCTSQGYKLLPYSQLNGLIWKNQIVDREFTFVDFLNKTPEERGEFSHFAYNICGKYTERYNSLSTIIGYLLHSHFSGKLKAVVFTDSRISEVANGRTGKTLLGQALGYIKKFTEINGKDFDPGNKHKYQEVELDTQIIHLNDVRKNFDFENLFNDITEGIVVDKKNVKPFKVKAKMIISTNKTISIEGASAKDRAVEFEFADYYNEKFSPEDEFKHWFFRDWSDDEWIKFYNFCLLCISTYLKENIVAPASINLNRRKLLENTNNDFTEFMDSQVKEGLIKAGVEYDKKELFERFLEDSPEYAEIKTFRQRRFTEYLRAYARYSGHFAPVDPEIHERKCGSSRYITFPPL